MVQTVLLALLFLRLIAFEARMDLFTESTQKVSSTEQVATPSAQSKPVTGQAGLDGHQLRQLIREELQAVRDINASQYNDSASETKDPIVDRAEMQYQRDLVAEELENLKGKDEVTSGELEMLMGDIARLDPDARTELLKMLNQAINRGEIKGHL